MPDRNKEKSIYNYDAPTECDWITSYGACTEYDTSGFVDALSPYEGV